MQQPLSQTGSSSLSSSSSRPALAAVPGLRQFGSSHDAAANSTGLEARLTPSLFREVRDVWFGHFGEDDSLVAPTAEHRKLWFQGGEEMDAICVERFGATLAAIQDSGAKTGEEILNAAQPDEPLDWLGLIILLDQIPRNSFRGAAAKTVFTVFDPLARAVAHAALQRGIPDTEPGIRWRFVYRTWFYMPLMHSEDAATHETARRAFERMKDDAESLLASEKDAEDGGGADEHRAAAAGYARRHTEAVRKHVDGLLGYEKMHADIVARFGRYPHRNAAMGRETTPEEKEYLENGGQTFGS